MASKKARVPAADDTANRNPIVDSWKKSHDNAIHSFVQLITSVAGRPDVFCTRLDRHPTDVWASRTQFLDRARPTLRASHDPDILLEMQPEPVAVQGANNPLLYSTDSTGHPPAALPSREDLR
jgi:hypothetical protein